MMIATRGALTGFIFGALFSALMVSASEHEAGVTGNEAAPFLLSAHQYALKNGGFRAGYVAGSADAFLLALHFGETGKALHDFSSCSNSWGPFQLMAVVDRYLVDQDTERHLSAALLSHAAFKAKCPTETDTGG